MHLDLSWNEGSGTAPPTVADTGDRFFLTLPFLRLSLVSTHPRNPPRALGHFAKSLLLPTAFGVPLALAFRSFCCSCLRVSRYVVSLSTGSLLLLHVRLPGLAPYLLARFHAVACTLLALPPHSIELDSRNSLLHFA